MLSLLFPAALAAALSTAPSPTDSQGILQALFAGTKAKVEGATARSRFKEVKIEGGEPKVTNCGAAEVKVLLTVPAREVDSQAGPDETYAVTQTTCEEHGCHGCGVFLGVARLKKSGATWAKIGEYKFRQEIGQWGQEERVPQVVRLSPTAIALRYDGSGMGQGYVQTACNLFVLEKDGRLRWVAQLIETTSNEGNCDDREPSLPRCYTKSFTVALSEKSTGGWRELEAKVAGKELDDHGKLVDVQRTDIYRYQNGKYQLVKR